MLTAVAWNYTSPFFQIRLYSTTIDDDLVELSFTRNSGGWAPAGQSVSAVVPEALLGPEAPLSAVSAVVVEGEWKTKVYFHPSPRRKIICEWDVCAKTPLHAGVTRVSTGAIAKRKMEEETRVKIAEEKERLRKIEEKKRQEELKRVEAEKKRQEELKRVEAEKKRQEELQRVEAEKKSKEGAAKYKNVPQGGKITISDPKKAERIQKASGCTAGFEWIKVAGGWQCGGGGHNITDAEFNAA